MRRGITRLIHEARNPRRLRDLTPCARCGELVEQRDATVVTYAHVEVWPERRVLLHEQRVCQRCRRAGGDGELPEENR